MEKEITIYNITNDFIFPTKVNARRVLKELLPEYNFWLHISITDGYNWTVTEGSCGCSIANGLTEKQALRDARSNLNKNDIEVVRRLINKKIEMVKKAKSVFLDDPLWNALSSAGYTCTESELSDIRQSLISEGYEITKIKTD